jgi:hypothetical protein
LVGAYHSAAKYEYAFNLSILAVAIYFKDFMIKVFSGEKNLLEMDWILRPRFKSDWLAIF